MIMKGGLEYVKKHVEQLLGSADETRERAVSVTLSANPTEREQTRAKMG